MADPGLPGDAPLELWRGDTYTWRAAIVDDDGAPLDLSGRTWVSQIRADRDRGTVIATIDVDDTDADTGIVVLTLASAESAKLVTVKGRGTYYWDLQADDAGVVKTWLAGKVKVQGDVSVGVDDEVGP